MPSGRSSGLAIPTSSASFIGGVGHHDSDPALGADVCDSLQGRTCSKSRNCRRQLTRRQLGAVGREAADAASQLVKETSDHSLLPAWLFLRLIRLGAQAGEARIRDVVATGGFKNFRRAAETPFNLVFEARP